MQAVNYFSTAQVVKFHSTVKSSCKGEGIPRHDSGESPSSQTAATTLFPLTKWLPSHNHRPTTYTNAATHNSSFNSTMPPWATLSYPRGSKPLTLATSEGGEDSPPTESGDSSSHQQSANSAIWTKQEQEFAPQNHHSYHRQKTLHF